MKLERTHPASKLLASCEELLHMIVLDPALLEYDEDFSRILSYILKIATDNNAKKGKGYSKLLF